MNSYFALTSEQVQDAVTAVINSKPVYAEILDFYAAVFNAQEVSKGRLQLQPLELSEELQAAKAREKLPLIGIEEFAYERSQQRFL